MKNVAFYLGLFLIVFTNIINSNDVFANQQATSPSCGIKPIAKIVCTVGQCV